MNEKNEMGFQRNAAGIPQKQGLYDPAFEHDSCGIGFVVRIDGIPRHAIVKNGIQILVNLEHRGAVGGDKSTGDGAGILLQIPDRFFRKTCPEIQLPEAGFLPGLTGQLAIQRVCDPAGNDENGDC